MEAVWGLFGVVLGALGVYFFVVPALRAKAAANDAAVVEVARLTAQLESLKERIEDKEKDEQRLKDAVDSLSLKHLQTLLEETKKISAQDSEQRRRSIEETLKPFQDRLKELDGHNREIEKERRGAYDSVIEQIKALGEQQTGLTKETNRLVRALQDPGSAGSWGEMVLERVVEMAGLLDHYTYEKQDTALSEDGNQRPDMIVNLPGGKTLIIDSKAPMRAYIEGLETPDEDLRASFFRGHAGKLYEHAKELKRRDYSKRDGAPDFTIMFVPSESAFRTALEHRPTLIEECMECNVVLATPTTLLALLRAVNYGWQQDKLAKAADEIRRDAGTLYERIVKLAEHYNKLGKALRNAGEAYNEFGGSLEGRVLPAARKFKDDGVSSNKDVAAVEPIEFHPRPLQAPELTDSVSLPFVEHDLDGRQNPKKTAP